ncbi:MAG: hypothetical protein ACI4OS_05090 [Akkermansia sp.]
MQEVPHVLGFTAGELSPWLACRFDLQAYQRGAARICNLMVLPYGGVRRRRGTLQVEQLDGLEGENVRLFAFSFARGDSLMLVFVPGQMWVYREGQRLQRDGSPYALETPWVSAEQLTALRLTQINDTVYACCPTLAPRVLSRLENTLWRLQTPDLYPYPRATYRRQDVALTIRYQYNSDVVTLELPNDSEIIFTPEMANNEYVVTNIELPTKTYFRNRSIATGAIAMPDLSTTAVAAGKVVYYKTSNDPWYQFYTCIRTYFTSNYVQTSNPRFYPMHFMPGYMLMETFQTCEVHRDWELHTTGTWNMQWELWRSYDDASVDYEPLLWDWERIKLFEQSGYAERKNWALSGSEERPCRMALVWRSGDALSCSPFVYFTAMSGTRSYKLLITEFIDAHHVKARNVSRALVLQGSHVTKDWSFGAMGISNGYPSFSAFHQGRLWFGGIPGLPTTLLASTVDDFDDFYVGSGDSDALHLTLSSDDQSRITWMCAARQLLMGTSESEWALNASDGGAITASSANFVRQSSVGSAGLPVIAVENSVLFIQRGGKRLREISYKLESDGFAAADLSLLAEHLFAAGVREWCLQRGTNFCLWLLMQDGSVAVLTMNLEQQVTAWQCMQFPGREVLHIASIPDSDSDEDEVWFVIRNRTSGTLTLERLCAEGQWVDAPREMTVGEDETLCGLELWAGCEVSARCGEQQIRAVVSPEGTLTLPGAEPGSRWLVGAVYYSELNTLPLESAASFHTVRQLSRVRLRLQNSALDFDYKSAASPTWESFNVIMLPGGGSEPYTGSVRLAQMPDADVGKGLCLRYGGDADWQLLALSVENDYHGR